MIEAIRSSGLSGFVFGNTQLQAWYRWPDTGPAAALDLEVKTYRAPGEIDRTAWMDLGRQMGKLSRLMFSLRMRRGVTRLLMLPAPDGVAAYGWLSDMVVYRKYWSFAGPGWMLGPYATRPDWQRRGLYMRLLRHSISLLRELDDRPLFIFALHDNGPSRRVIETAGFHPMGVFEVRLGLGGRDDGFGERPDVPAKLT